MFQTSSLPKLSKKEITRLSGGKIRGEKIFIEVIGAVYFAQLENNMQSQRFPAHPRGYQPFRAPQGLLIYDIARETVEVPFLRLYGNRYGESRVEQPARLFKPARTSEEYWMLQNRARQRELRDRVFRRVFLQSDHDSIRLVADLLSEQLGVPRWVNRSGSPLEQIERYIGELSPEQLAGLLALMEIQPHPQAFAKAA